MPKKTISFKSIKEDSLQNTVPERRSDSSLDKKERPEISLDGLIFTFIEIFN
mgnify:CR=1 FL=1